MIIKDKLLRQILSEQKKTSDILYELSANGINVSGRAWRTFVRNYNNEYDQHDRYIASDNRGYYLTTSKKKIGSTVRNKLKCGLSMVKNAKEDLKNLSMKDQLSLLEDEPDLMDLYIRMGE